MKRSNYSQGKFITIELLDKTRFFVEAIPDGLTIRKMRLKVIPSRQTCWEFRFPFYIRTATKSWETSEEILETVISILEESDCPNEESLLLELNDYMTPFLESWEGTNAQRCREVGLTELGKYYREP